MADSEALHLSANVDTIVAIATPAGQGGVGIIRLSGPQAQTIGRSLTDRSSGFTPRLATYCAVYDADHHELDQGLGLSFPAPHSFTGENVFEFQGHGSPVVMRLLIKRCIELGARMARPGEFSERAFLNDKLDLVQAEAIADLIESQTEAAARAALRSLRGDFSVRIHAITEELIALRVFVEAAIDFPEEEIDFLQEHDVGSRTAALLAQFKNLAAMLRRGALLRDAVRVVLIGPPNAGKSSLLNALSQDDRAIVSNIPGTTRDVLEQSIQIDGLPVILTDTAGLRESRDSIEQEGVKRARLALESADLALICVDDSLVSEATIQQIQTEEVPDNLPYCVVYNKADISGRSMGLEERESGDSVVLSAKTGEGLDDLCLWISHRTGVGDQIEGQVLARQRHIDAFKRAQQHTGNGLKIYQSEQAGELLAEELFLAQKALGEITGEFGCDDLLGEIFNNFCIGK